MFKGGGGLSSSMIFNMEFSKTKIESVPFYTWVSRNQNHQIPVWRGLIVIPPQFHRGGNSASEKVSDLGRPCSSWVQPPDPEGLLLTLDMVSPSGKGDYHHTYKIIITTIIKPSFIEHSVGICTASGHSCKIAHLLLPESPHFTWEAWGTEVYSSPNSLPSECLSQAKSSENSNSAKSLYWTPI